MFGQQDPSKTEKATDKRRKKARSDGSVAKSQDMPKTGVLIIGTIACYYAIPFMYKQFYELWHFFWRDSFTTSINKEIVYQFFLYSSQKIAFLVLPILIPIAFAAYFLVRLQVGQLWTTKNMQPKFGKVLNPMAGLKRLFISPENIIRMGKQFFQAAIIAIAPYIVLKREFNNILPLFYQNASAIAQYILWTGFIMVAYTFIPLILLAIVDTIYAFWKYSEDLKMSKDEVKDERKQLEGDPQIKAQQRQKMMEMMQKRMMEQVPKADVIITNPTHFAVALQYNPLIAPAPLVVAKGVDHLAERIKEIARENNVPIRENKALAQALYKSVQIGDIIPEELYQAVAVILSQLAKFKRRKK
ncbi:flagellar biosynthesis protein FlhB [Desulfovibrio inopinatus]|uniref:flagellar biosynthesis protein FlhB n=1 Tax=Desulfovibrio inopinatus TaxID=102109 RepID=UPI0004098EAB|nr:flagellar biosynthesis protein FlhB [Desulfovibrio inopinatus]